jgi:tetratricopeptide (TPR) repeat protein
VSVGRSAWCVVVLLCAFVVPAPARASEPALRATLEEAIETYTRGLNTEERAARLETFRRAQLLFATAASTGVENAALYTNLGNAALQAEDLGGAILAYRRALRLEPDHGRARQNLDHARSRLPAWVPRPAPEGAFDSFFFWHRTLPLDQRKFVAAGCFAAALVLVAAGIRVRQSALRNAAILPFVAWAALLGSVLLDPSSGDTGEAVVTLPEVVARAADSALAPSAFAEPLPSGVEVQVIEDRSPWLRVRLANGRDAWLPQSSVAWVDESS